ncbi:extracellular solute-binding protein, partial [Blautia pseudococcoides]|nr:extracellular solute-binding protein [Blautia pseudococcoides]
EKAAELYAKDHPGFQVKVTEMQSDDIETKVTTAVSAGDLSTLPDIFLMQDNSFQKYATNYPDVFTDLSDSGVDFTQFSSAKAAYSTVDGKNLGVPFDNGAVINCLRTDYLEQAGFTIDDFTDISWSEFMEKAKVVKEKTGQPMITAQAGSPDQIMMMLQSCGASMFNEDGSINIVGNDALKECMEIYTQMVKDGTLVEVTDWDQYVASINNGTVAGAMNGCWIMATVTGKEDQSGNWAITDMPKLDKSEGASNYSNSGGSSWVITSNCKNKELAKDFFKSTFAGSTELYDDLISKGALSTWAPAAESDIYNQDVAFFGNDAVYAKIVDFATKTPSNITGPFYYDARDAIGVALSNITQQNADMDAEIEKAQATVEFNMGG